MKRSLVLLFALLLVLGACGGGDEAEPSADQGVEEPAPEEEGGEEVEAAEVGGETEIEMEADDFYFEPATLRGEAGQELTLAIHNEGDAPHTFTAEDLDIDEELQPGDEIEVTVTFPDSGSVEFICRFHSGQGMSGSLEVAG